MKRARVVTVATMAGLAGVVSFHTKSTPLSLGALRPVGTAPGASAPSSSPTPAGGAGTRPTTPPTAGTGTTSATRTAIGAAVNYNYGILAVSATVSGTKLTNVTIASIDDGGSSRSQSIDQQSLPVLEQQALQAQGSGIQGVSGASYTSAGFQQSLQSALTKLGFR